MRPLKQFLLMLCILNIHSIYAQSAKAGGSNFDTSSATVRIADPFARGVQKPFSYGEILSSNLPEVQSPSNAKFSAQTTGDNMRRLPDISSYRLVGVSSKPISQKPNIVGPHLTMPVKGEAPLQYYIRLGAFNQLSYAKQYAWDFFATNKILIDANFVIRKAPWKEGGNLYQIDYGPFADYDHAVISCDHLTKYVVPPVTKCPLVREYMSSQEHPSFTSNAIVGLSAATISQLSESEMYEPKRLIATNFKIKEGDKLGTGEYMVVKINQDGVYLAKLNSNVYFLPIDIIPFSAPGSSKEDKNSSRDEKNSVKEDKSTARDDKSSTKVGQSSSSR
jgi:hypothetical protein